MIIHLQSKKQKFEAALTALSMHTECLFTTDKVSSSCLFASSVLANKSYVLNAEDVLRM